MNNLPRYAEFFCGGGMVHAGLKDSWTCAFANDIDPMKCAVFRDNWGGSTLVEGDIAELDPAHLRQPIDLYWASSPCQDVSVAGAGRGLSGARSGVFHHWIEAIRTASDEGFAPRILAFENVVGLLTRNQGRDFVAVVRALTDLGYMVGALEINAAPFLPQSRPRLFVVAVRRGVDVRHLVSEDRAGPFHTDKIKRFVEGLPKDLARSWLWWHHEAPPPRARQLPSVINARPETEWLSDAEVDKLLSMMSNGSATKVARARSSGRAEIGMLYKRGRPDEQGRVRQRAEVRFDGLAGCLRTPSGGSSRQTVLFIKGNETWARLLCRSELIALMGLPKNFKMPERYNQAYHVAGDGVAVPIVRYLDTQLFQSILRCTAKRQAA